MKWPTYDMKAGELIAGARTLWVPMVPQPVKDSEGMFGTLWRWMEFVGVAEMIEIMMEDRCPYRIGQTLALREERCDYRGCDEMATVRGFAVAFVSAACDRHAQDGMFSKVCDLCCETFGPIAGIAVKRLSEATEADAIDAMPVMPRNDKSEWKRPTFFRNHITALHGTADWFWVLGRDT